MPLTAVAAVPRLGDHASRGREPLGADNDAARGIGGRKVMARPKILNFAVFDTSADSNRKLEAAGYEVVVGSEAWMIPGTSREDEVREVARDAVALIGTSMRSNPISKPIMEASQRLRIVAKYTVGVDDVDVDAATDLGIMVTHGPTEANCFGVAEYTMAMMLSLLKKLGERDAAVRRGEWRTPALMSTFLGRRDSDGHKGITVGIIGLGRIGARVAELLAPWRLRVIASDPYIPDERFVRYGVEKVDLATLLRESDVVTVHCNLTKETNRFIGPAQFAQMKPNAIFINNARGKIIDEAALADALKSSRIAGAGVDAFSEEPLGKDHPLRGVGDRIILSPHASSYTFGGSLGPGVEWATRSVLAALDGEVPDNVYNTEVIPRWKERFGGVKVLAGR